MIVSMRMTSLILLIFLLFPIRCIKAQTDYSEMLTCMLESSHWEDFYCKDANKKIQMEGIITQNKIPHYEGISLQGRSVYMRASARRSERFLMYIRKFSVQEDFVSLKVLYDKRVKATFRLKRKETGQWFVASSTIKRKYPCEGRVKNKSFVWNF